MVNRSTRTACGGSASRAKGVGGMADWKQISGGLTRIAVGSRTNVWGVNSAGNIYRYN
ncbi:tectonin domain-containing protein, partial [Streptomyces eurythermus]|uniref:tectonin domain-containing protein n=1 Tax=Streptomyces eurythermus TaxID=42237 RepID=UPI0037B702F2